MQWAKSDGRRFRTRGDEVCEWIEEHCTLTDSVWIGQPFRLLPWQRRLLYELFEVGEDGRRRYRMALIGVARKQGKSELAAAIGLYLAFGTDDDSAAVYCAAASEDQADVVFEKARRMCELSESLAAAVEVPQGMRVSQPRLTLKQNPYQFLQRLSAKGKTKHGLNPSAVILDELHVWGVGEGEELYEALTTAMAARPEGLILAITTAGANIDDSRCGVLYRLGERMRAGEVQDPTFFYRWWQAPDGCAIDDPAAWRAASPSLGGIVDEDFYRGELVRIPEAHFRRLYLNQWTAVETEWLPPAAWGDCDVGPFALDEGVRTAGGWDASTRRDSTAVVLAQPRQCPAGRRHIRVQGRAWERPVDLHGRADDAWRVPMAEVVAHVRSCFERYDLAEFGMGYDPAFIAWEAAELEATGLLVVEFPQTPTRMVKASAALYELICMPCECGRPRLEHDGDPVLARHVAGVQARMVRGGGQMLEKRDRGVKIDMAVALAMAVSLINQFEEEGHEFNVYEI